MPPARQKARLAEGAMDTHEERIEGRQALAESCADLIPSLQREWRLLTATLDGRVFGQKTVIDRLRQVGIQDRRARFRFIVHPEIRPRRSTHSLIALSRRLPSRMAFRQLPETMRAEKRDLLLLDTRAALSRADPEARQAKLVHDRARIREWVREF